MAITQQRLNSINYTELKSLRNFVLSLETNNVTGIFGVNGSGKSSLIYSIVSIYKPSQNDPNRFNFKFSQFFTHTSHTKYLGSSFEITHSYRQDLTVFNNVKRTYSKSDRWRPRYENRPERDVYFVGINSCVPDIELEKSQNIIRFTATTNLVDALSNEIRQNASVVMNKQYDEYNNIEAGNKKFIGVRNNGIQYSSLAMGAGEQRVFKILNTVFKATRYSLIIIDEIDLTLHTDALNRLITILVNRANDRNLQIIFTSHREELTNRTDINIRHIHQIGNNTFCFTETNPDCISRLTGQQIRTLEIFVEDDLSESIVQKVVEELNIRRHCSIKRFGSIDNGFALATGLFLKGEDLTNILVLLDGDRYKVSAEKMTQMEKYFAGTEPAAVANRNSALSCIRQYSIPTAETPEQFINRNLREINDNTEIVLAAAQINAVANKHEYVNQIIALLGYNDKTTGLNRVVDKLSTSPNWTDYTQEIRNWLNNRIVQLNL
ncbi:AAA family ATPase [Flavobacterium sp. LC2016-23]|uniref:AAA family ATPase n=1 Tax=Flavobacterium sp. LC2016-23 TaxID=2666330 RepID=UPI0012B1392B|nr:AAA family ATPase [Flavobacterium sp. LC2016-23]MRX42017.1 AAA family ATPase [Flavobacterium sp. LC2016-23]